MRDRTFPFLLILVMALFFMLSCGNGDDDDNDADAADDDDDDNDDDDNDDDDNDDANDDDNDDDDDTAPPGPLALTVMTYNILFDFPNPEYDNWGIRKEQIAEIINFHAPDLVGLQEPLPWQTMALHDLCPGYAEVSIPLDPDAALFYKEDRFTLLDQGHFWLSPHPERPSIGFGNFMPRYVTWAALHDNESEQEFYFFNTHFDNTSPFQETAAPMFLDMVEEIIGSSPVVITGDFNSKPDTEAYAILTSGNSPGDFALTNSFDLAPDFDVRLAPGDEREYDPDHRIDHIFVASGDWDCSYWVVDMTRYGDPWRDPSDHLAMSADITLAQ